MNIQDKILTDYMQKAIEFDELREKLSEMIKTVKERYADNEIEIEREGKKVMVKEKDLWEEIRLLRGIENQAGEVLKAKYPELWETQEIVDKKANEIMALEKETFGFSSKEMTMSRVVSLIIEFVRLEFEKRNK